jgi:hypothetical protein
VLAGASLPTRASLAVVCPMGCPVVVAVRMVVVCVPMMLVLPVVMMGG